jgi:hypothetical protein
MKVRYFLILASLGLAMLACQAIPSVRGAASLPGNVLFQDDFSRIKSGWDRVNSPSGVTDYIDGAYRIFVNTKNSDVWANPGLSFSDVQVDVDATKVAGDENNDFGVICRYQDSQNFYFFVVSSDGYYGIGKLKEGKQQLIGVENMPPTDKIKSGNATNHLRADCVGNQLVFYANGAKLSEQTDSDFTAGDVGLIAGAFDNPGTDIHFDNFSVVKP